MIDNPYYLLGYKPIDVKAVKTYHRNLIKHYENVKELTAWLKEYMKKYEGKKITKRIETDLRNALLGKFHIKTFSPWKEEKDFAYVRLVNDYSYWELKFEFESIDGFGKSERVGYTIGKKETFAMADFESVYNTGVIGDIDNWIIGSEKAIATVNKTAKKFHKALDMLNECEKDLGMIHSQFYMK